MGINTDLSQPPYFDDFDEAKQFNRVLFKPARAVQTRELNQLQSILQNQVERFGSNVYKEGTIISGVNMTDLNDLEYVKIKDSADLEDPTAFRPYEGIKYFLTSVDSGLKAEIIFAQNGFETRNPDLKTFYILYANTGQQGDGTEVKRFQINESLRITDNKGNEQSFTITVANVANPVGRSFGVICDEGVVYQKGHFIFVEEQLAIVSKYSESPDNVSIGFNITENIIDAGLDETLYDNAQGFNNFIAPGADRLQLKPVLSVYPAGEEPEQFFTIIKYENGSPIQIRSVTQFNSIATEMATRTFEESGSYVVRGMRCSIEQETIDGDTKSYVAVSPGKAYVEGYAVESFASKYIEIEKSDVTSTRNGQYSNVDYGLAFTFEADQDGRAFHEFENNGLSYDVFNSDDVLIARTCIRHIEIDASGLGKIFIYNFRYVDGQENNLNKTVARIETTPILNSGKLTDQYASAAMFDMGKDSIQSVSLSSYVRSTSQSFNITDSESTNFTKTLVASGGGTRTPVPDVKRIFAVNSVNQLKKPLSIQIVGSGDVEVTFDGTDGNPIARVYYLETVQGLEADSLEEKQVVVKSTITNTDRRLQLGLPNVVKLLKITEIQNPSNAEVDRTSEYTLVTNAKSTHFDYSYLEPSVNTEDRPGGYVPIATSSSIIVEAVALKRVSSVGSGYLTSSSYENISEDYALPFEAGDGRSYDLKTTIDFRPYMKPVVAYAASRNTAQVVDRDTINLKQVVSGVQPARDTSLITDQTFYLSRFDSIVLDYNGEFSTVKGGAGESPAVPITKGMFEIGRVLVPGGPKLKKEGVAALRVSSEAPRNYTMKEIQQIDNRLKSLTETVSLNLLEKSANDLFIPNEFGYNRFKNGILVDNFKTLQIADLQDNEFRSAIDRNRGINMPAIKQFPIEMKIDESAGRFEKFDGVVTIPTVGVPQSFISQPFATRSRNAVSNYYKYNATVFIDPEFDAGYNTTENPAVNLDIDLTTPFTSFLETLQDFVPLTTTAVRNIVSSTGWRNAGVAANGWPRRRITTTRTTTRTETGIEVDNQTQEQNVGSFVTDVGFQPYMRSRDIRIVATGLRPNTVHHLFFNEELMDEFFVPGSIPNLTSAGSESPRLVRRAGEAGNGVRSDSSGTLTAIFEMPENRFFVGEGEIFMMDVNQWEERDSAASSFAKKVYRAYSFDLERTALTATTRTPEFNTVTNTTTTRSVTTRTRTIRPPAPPRRWPFDPIAQTFFVKREAAQNTDCLYVAELDIYFRGQDEDNVTMADVTDKGVNIEIREVENGYPTTAILPFGKKRLRPSQVFVSEDASVPTRIVFDDPIRLNVEKEYAFVVRPDGNDPNYLVWTSKVGGRDVTSNLAVTQDWGEGVLFTSTNNSAWKSYQDEDIKFNIKRAVFDSTNNGSVFYRPNEVEFFSIEDAVGSFRSDEDVYTVTGNPLSAGIDRSYADNSKLLLSGNGLGGIQTNDKVLLTSEAGERFISRVSNANIIDGTGTLFLDASPSWADVGATITVRLVKSGKVSYFNPKRPNMLYLYDSSSRTDLYFDEGDVVTGFSSGSTASITSVDDVTLSYYQPNFYVNNSTNTSTDFVMVNAATNQEVDIPGNAEVYLTDEKRVLYSQSSIFKPGNGIDTQEFAIKINMSNNGKNNVSPIIDNDLKIINAYQYRITDQETTSSRYVAKEVVLQNDMAATGLKVLLTAFRPIGTNIQAYARFKYPTSNEDMSSWVELVPNSTGVYSNASNQDDFREFEYNLDETRPSKTVNWSNIYDDMIGVAKGTITSGPYYDFLDEQVTGGAGTFSRMDINNDGANSLDDAALLKKYGLTQSIPEAQELWVETQIEDYLLAFDPIASPLSDDEGALFGRYVNTVSADEEFSSFQVKLVYTNDIGIDVNIFPHVRDFRAIALT